MLVAQGKLEEALKAYRDSLAIRERLAAADRSNTEWQSDLSLRRQGRDRCHEEAGYKVDFTTLRDGRGLGAFASPRHSLAARLASNSVPFFERLLACWTSCSVRRRGVDRDYVPNEVGRLIYEKLMQCKLRSCSSSPTLP